MFDERLHVANGPIGYDGSLPLFVGMDFGFTHPFVALWVQLVNTGEYVQLRVIDEYVIRERLNADSLEVVQQMHRARGYAPPCGCFAEDHGGKAAEGKQEIERILAWPTTRTALGIPAGSAIVRWLLAKNNNGDPRLIVAPHCVNTIRGFLTLQCQPGTELPRKENDDEMEALRRIASNVVTVEGINDEATRSRMELLRQQGATQGQNRIGADRSKINMPIGPRPFVPELSGYGAFRGAPPAGFGSFRGAPPSRH
jgi:hypothetical protein